MQQQEYTILYKLLAKFLFPYHHFPIVQWGLIKQNHSGDITYTINFPISFSNNCFAGLAKNYNATEDTWTGGTGGDVIQSISASQMVYKSGFDLTATGAVYFAIGV